MFFTVDTPPLALEGGTEKQCFDFGQISFDLFVLLLHTQAADLLTFYVFFNFISCCFFLCVYLVIH